MVEPSIHVEHEDSATDDLAIALDSQETQVGPCNVPKSVGATDRVGFAPHPTTTSSPMSALAAGGKAYAEMLAEHAGEEQPHPMFTYTSRGRRPVEQREREAVARRGRAGGRPARRSQERRTADLVDVKQCLRELEAAQHEIGEVDVDEPKHRLKQAMSSPLARVALVRRFLAGVQKRHGVREDEEG
jgi:hypothetical protein